jgi:hypothetical protein
MKKAELISILDKKFTLVNNQLVAKLEQPISKLTNTIISPKIGSSLGMTAGQQRVLNTINKIERKELNKIQMKKDVDFASRIRGGS